MCVWGAVVGFRGGDRGAQGMVMRVAGCVANPQPGAEQARDFRVEALRHAGQMRARGMSRKINAIDVAANFLRVLVDPGNRTPHLLRLPVSQLGLSGQALPQLVQRDVAVAVGVERLEQLQQAVDLLVAVQRSSAVQWWCKGG